MDKGLPRAELRAIAYGILRETGVNIDAEDMTRQEALHDYAGAAPLFGEGPSGDWHGTVHEPVPGNPNVKATNIHVTDAWVLSDLAARFGRCFRVLDSDIHFFCADDAAEAALRVWLKTRPDPDALPPNQAMIVGYPYGVRSGNPIVSSVGEYAIEHLPGRRDCHYYNWFAEPNAGGKSGSPVFAVDANDEHNPDAFGINVARGSTWQAESVGAEPRLNHWAVVQCYHSGMTLQAAE